MIDETKPGIPEQHYDLESIEELKRINENNVALIRRQNQEIEDLKHELDTVLTERDMLLCEVSKLKFEIEFADLKRINDLESFVTSNKNDRGSTNCLRAQGGALVCKKASVRDGSDMLKRPRVQTTYELSQDLLDKQIEMLERKYGGVKARNAALTIQRAFRRYTLLNKFAAITAMAKAEKRLSRRLPDTSESSSNTNLNTTSIHGREDASGCRTDGTMRGSLPLRSMSMRERRHVESLALPMPRSQSGRCDSSVPSSVSPSATVSPGTSHATPASTGVTNTTVHDCYGHNHYWESPHFYVSHDAFTESGELNDSLLNRDSPVRRTIGATPPIPSTSVSSSSSGLRLSSTTASPPSNTGTPTSISANSKDRQIRNRIPQSHKIPPEVPKRTSSISARSQHRTNGGGGGLTTRSRENGGSLSSVQSSGSDSSVSTATTTDVNSEAVVTNAMISASHRGSPVWKRKTHEVRHGSLGASGYDEPTVEMHPQHTIFKVSETVRKRQYRVGLNLFNKKPERGISYLIRRGFLENTPQGVARFLISRKGLSKQMIGEYLGNLQNPFNMAVLECFSQELDLSDMQVDVALRKFQTYFRMPGEAQKIERLMEIFGQRYCQCDRDIVATFRSPDTVFVLAFAIIMLNTDLHTPNLKPERKMKPEDFIKNLRGIDDGADIDRDMLVGIYERVKASEFKPGSDHVTQVMKVQSTIVGKKPNMALPHRRLVCYCRLYEIPDVGKKERPGVHQREVFLFNDLLVITKILSKKKSSVTYTFRQSFPLCGMVVTLFDVPHYQYGIRLSQRVDMKVLVTFNARNEHDRGKFAEDLRESISEMDEMESLRIDAELERQKSSRGGRSSAASENRDSGVADVEVCPCIQAASAALNGRSGGSTSGGGAGGIGDPSVEHDTGLKRSALSNSLLDIHEQFPGEKTQARRGSMGSLDSGMSISLQSVSTSSASHESSTPSHTHKGNRHSSQQSSFLGGFFNKRDRKNSRTEELNIYSRITEV